MLAVLQSRSSYLAHAGFNGVVRFGQGSGRGRRPGSKNGVHDPRAEWNGKIVGKLAKDQDEQEKTNNMPSNPVQTNSSRPSPRPKNIQGTAGGAEKHGYGLNSQANRVVNNMGTSYPNTLNAYNQFNSRPGANDTAAQMDNAAREAAMRKKAEENFKESAQKSAWEGKNAFEKLASDPGKALSEAWNQGVSWLKTAGADIVNFGKSVWEKVTSGIGAAGKWVNKNIVNPVDNAVFGTRYRVQNQDGSMTRGRRGGLLGEGGLVDTAKDAVQDFWEGPDRYHTENYRQRIESPVARQAGPNSTMPDEEYAIGERWVSDGRSGGMRDRLAKFGEDAQRTAGQVGKDIGSFATKAYNAASDAVVGAGDFMRDRVWNPVADRADVFWNGYTYVDNDGNPAQMNGFRQKVVDPTVQFLDNTVVKPVSGAAQTVGNAASSAFNNLGAQFATQRNGLPEDTQLAQFYADDPDTGREGAMVVDSRGNYYIQYNDGSYRPLDQNDVNQIRSQPGRY